MREEPLGRGRGRDRSAHDHHHRRTRCRWREDDLGWHVSARIERFVEPALLLALRDHASHGYDLADLVAEMAPAERVDLGNLYRLLNSLETDGLVRGIAQRGGRRRRTYELTDEGRAALDAWAASLRRARDTVDAFLTRYG